MILLITSSRVSFEVTLTVKSIFKLSPIGVILILVKLILLLFLITDDNFFKSQSRFEIVLILDSK